MFLSKEVKLSGSQFFVWGHGWDGPDLQHFFTAGKGIKLFTYIICHLEI